MDILNLPSLRVMQTEIDDSGYTIQADRSTPEKDCIHCGSTEIVRHGTKLQTFNDCCIHGRHTALRLLRHRYRCKVCGRTFLDRQPDLDDKHLLTRRAADYLAERSLSQTFASLSREIGVDEKTVRNVFRENVARLAIQFRFETPR